MRTGRQSRDRVLVLSKSQILREGLKSIVAKVPKLHLSPVAAQVQDLLELADLYHPRIVLVALADGCDKEMEAIERLTSQFSDMAVLVLDTEPSPDRLNRSLLAGARGYFPLEASVGEVLASVGLTSPRLFLADAQLADRFRSQAAAAAPEASIDLVLEGKRLAPREKEVLQLLAMGKTNQEIADSLSYSLSTVKNVCQRLFIKLGWKTASRRC